MSKIETPACLQFLDSGNLHSLFEYSSGTNVFASLPTEKCQYLSAVYRRHYLLELLAIFPLVVRGT